MAANSELTNIFQESDTCKQCQQTVGEVNSICCDICNTWYHLKCTKISLKQFKSIFLADTCTWYCNFCLHEALPFSSINDNSLEKLSCPTKAQKYTSKMISSGVFTSKCSSCNKKIANKSKCIPCSNCKCLVHKKCSNTATNFDKSKNITTWFCPSCLQANLQPSEFTTAFSFCRRNCRRGWVLRRQNFAVVSF